jgi:hypothetical protein
LLIAALKANISVTLPPGLFLFSGALSKLKSPTINHFVSVGISIFYEPVKEDQLALRSARGIYVCQNPVLSYESANQFN